MARRATSPASTGRALLAALVLAVACASSVDAVPAPTTYIPPVDAPVALSFRPPTHLYGAGNRGVDYATEAGDPVWASAPGVVVFAGTVGRSVHVVVLHADGIRTTYAFLDRALVKRGQAVRAGDRVGLAAGQVHFGARAGNAYLDPLELLAGRHGKVRLVPSGGRRATEAEERSAVERLLRGLSRIGRGGAGASRAAVAWASRRVVDTSRVALDGLRDYAQWALAMGMPLPAVLRFIEAAAVWSVQECTPASSPPPRLRQRRLVVLVAGFQSSWDGRGVDIDTAALGYAPTDRFRFSYRGGAVEDHDCAAGGRSHPACYAPEDTETDMEVTGARLAELLSRLAREHPGVPIDVIAHSQGGVVTRVAVDQLQRSSVPLSHVVTLASPHGGSDLATAGAVMTSSTGAKRVIGGAAKRAGLADPTSVAVGQLAEHSPFMADMPQRGWGPGVQLTSIAARHDYVVPSPRCFVDGATNATVTVPGLDDHSALPGSPAGLREVALAVNDRPPTCETLEDVWTDTVHGELISRGEDALGLVAAGLDNTFRPVPGARPARH